MRPIPQKHIPAHGPDQAFRPGPARGPVLITGANGLLGQYLVKELIQGGKHVVATGRGTCRLPEEADFFSGAFMGSRSSEGARVSAFCPGQNHAAPAFSYMEMDFTYGARVRSIMDAVHPSVVIHAGAMTQVDPCEIDPDSCRKTNVTGTEIIAREAARIGASLVFLSTDFIFDGLSGPYREDDAPHPLSVYGQSKWDAEQKVMATPNLGWAIVRTVLVYGTPLVGSRSNIITWVRSSLEGGQSIKVVSDQWRTPTYVGDLARGIHQIICQGAQGIYHLSGKDFMTPYDMAVRTARLLKLDESLLTRVDAATFTQPGPRPAVTGFIIDKAVADLGYDPVCFEEGILLTLGITKS